MFIHSQENEALIGVALVTWNVIIWLPSLINKKELYVLKVCLRGNPTDYFPIKECHEVVYSSHCTAI